MSFLNTLNASSILLQAPYDLTLADFTPFQKKSALDTRARRTDLIRHRRRVPLAQRLAAPSAEITLNPGKAVIKQQETYTFAGGASMRIAPKKDAGKTAPNPVARKRTDHPDLKPGHETPLSQWGHLLKRLDFYELVAQIFGRNRLNRIKTAMERLSKQQGPGSFQQVRVVHGFDANNPFFRTATGEQTWRIESNDHNNKLALTPLIEDFHASKGEPVSLRGAKALSIRS